MRTIISTPCGKRRWVVAGDWSRGVGTIELNSQHRSEKNTRIVLRRPRAKGARNVTTLDDNTTQAALSFLMQADRALGFGDPAIHESVEFALSSLLAAQYPNGAWPQRFTGPPDREKYPIKPASYPEDWPRAYPAKDYRRYYTYNDNTLVDMIELMFLAAAIYEDELATRQPASGRRFYHY